MSAGVHATLTDGRPRHPDASPPKRCARVAQPPRTRAAHGPCLVLPDRLNPWSSLVFGGVIFSGSTGTRTLDLRIKSAAPSSTDAQDSTFSAAADAPIGPEAAESSIVARPVEGQPVPRGALTSPLDEALADALRAATAAGDWGAVAELARTLRERGGRS